MPDYSHRLSKVKLRLLRRDGTPIIVQTVHADMQRHEFLFGAELFDSVEYASGE